MEKKTLFENESDSEEEIKIKFNEEYAKSYNKFRQKEFLKKFKDQDFNSDTDSDESESTEDEKIDPKFDKEFFKTLSSLKSKDPKIYDKSTKFFENLDNEKDEDNSKSAKIKPLTLKDYERKIILEKGGKFEDEDSENDVNEDRPQSPSYVEEQNKIKAQIKKVLNDSDEDEEGFGSIFKRRVKSKNEAEKEEEDYMKWLAGQKEEIEEATKDTLKPLKQYWDDPKLPRNEKFLRDYVLNKGYIDTQVHEIPTYEEIIGETDLSEDENELEKQAEFEQKYNFRYEEPDQEFIKRYPRTIENSVRISDDGRKKKRQEAKERKEKEKAEKMKELEMLKELKRQEIEEKINKLKEVTGNDDLPFKDDDLESEFDPDAHDKRMQEIFNDEYYEVDEGEEKPDCPDLEELKIEDWDNFDPDKDNINNDAYELNCEDPDFIMDCDYDPNVKEKFQKELINSTRDKRNRRRRNRFMEMIKTEKPVFDPEDEKTYAEYIDEYYKMDCEDFIGDAPCRFKYVDCEPNDFGLTIEEILLAKNKELNQWASLKKAVQIRPSHLDKKERRLYQMKAKNEVLKRKIFKSLYGEQSDEEEGDLELNKNKQNGIQNDETKVENKKKRKKKKKNNKSNKNNELISDNTNIKDDKIKSENKVKTSKKLKPNDSQDIIQNKNVNSQEQLDFDSNEQENENKITVSSQKEGKNQKINAPKGVRRDNFKSADIIENIKSNASSEFNTKTTFSNISIKSQEDQKQDTAISKEHKTENLNVSNENKNKSKKVSKHNSNVSQDSANYTKFKNRKEKISKGNKLNKVNKRTNGISMQSKTINKDNFKPFNSTNSKQISDERLKAYGLNPKKFHKKENFNYKNFSKKDRKKNNPFS